MRYEFSGNQMPSPSDRERSIHIAPAANPVKQHYLSAIVNCICPECGGPMGGRSNAFMCQGQCGTDWRPTWQSAFTAKSSKPQSAKGRLAA